MMEHVVLIVDEKDTLKRWMHDIRDIVKYSNFRAKFTACGTHDTARGETLKPTKIVFFLTQENNSVNDVVDVWMKILMKSEKKVVPYFIINIQENTTPNMKVEATQSPCDENETDERTLQVRNISDIYQWWPRLANFLFGRSGSVECLAKSVRTCFLLNLSPRYKKAAGVYVMLEKSLSAIGIELAETLSAAGCIICITRRGTVDLTSSKGGALRKAKMEGRPVHALLFRIEEITEEIQWATTYQHSVYEKRPLRPFLCILSDLRKTNIEILDHKTQEKLYPPTAPFHFQSRGDGEYVKLCWQESPSAYNSPISQKTWQYIVEIRVITRCFTKSSEWTIVHKEPSTGSGTRHEVVLRDLERKRPFQFRIYAQSETKRSKTRETNVFHPSGETTVYDDCGCMSRCLNKKRFCDCCLCIFTCGFSLWRHQVL